MLSRRDSFLAGGRGVALVLVGVVPFRLVAGALAALVAWRTGSVVATIASGLVALTALGTVL
jgi:branched-subunit amino acid transport protein